MSNYNKQFERLKVVVVDDQDTIRKAISRALAQMGFREIEEFSDGREAVEHLKKRHADLILCDLYMKHVSGFETLRYVRGRDYASDVPFVVVTGEAQRDEIVKANDLGAEHYLLKPFTAADLQRVVSAVCEAYIAPPPAVMLVRTAERDLLEGRLDDAKAAIEQALAMEPNGIRALYALAMMQAKKKEFMSSKRTLERIVEVQPSFYKSFRLLANIYLDHGDREQAVAHLVKELSINGAQEDRQTILGNCYLELKQFDGAIGSFREALKIDPKFLPALNGMGHAFARQGNFDKALYYFKRIRRYNASHQGALQNMIRYAESPEDVRKAEIAFKEEVGRHPQRPEARLALAKLYLKKENYEDCLKHVDHVLSEQENQRDALMLKLKLKMQQKLFDEALVIGKKLCEVSPTVEVFKIMGRLSMEKGKFAETLAMCEKALALDHKDKGILTLLCKAYHATGQEGKAYFTLMRLIAGSSSGHAYGAQIKGIVQKIAYRRQAVGLPPMKSFPKVS